MVRAMQCKQHCRTIVLALRRAGLAGGHYCSGSRTLVTATPPCCQGAARAGAAGLQLLSSSPGAD